MLLAVSLLLSSISVTAHCPLCTAAVGGAAVAAKYYGVDISVIGVLVGGFAISTGLWLGQRLKKEYIKFQLALIVLLSFFLTVLPLINIVGKETLYAPILLFGASGSIFNKVYWVDKFLLGSIVGSIMTLAAFWLHKYIKAVRGKVLVPFQGILLTVLSLAITSVGLYVILS